MADKAARMNVPGPSDILRITWVGIVLGAAGVVFGFWTVVQYADVVAGWVGFLIDMLRAIVAGLKAAGEAIQNSN